MCSTNTAQVMRVLVCCVVWYLLNPWRGLLAHRYVLSKTITKQVLRSLDFMVDLWLEHIGRRTRWRHVLTSNSDKHMLALLYDAVFQTCVWLFQTNIGVARHAWCTFSYAELWSICSINLLNNFVKIVEGIGCLSVELLVLPQYLLCGLQQGMAVDALVLLTWLKMFGPWANKPPCPHTDL